MKRNLLRMGLMSLLCAFGTFAWADEITLPNQDVVSCTFSLSKTAPDTDYFTFYTDNISSNTSYGSVTIGGNEYSYYIKIATEGLEIIKFTTLTDNTNLTLIVGPNDNLTGEKYILVNDDKVYVSSQVVTYTCEKAGNYTISKGTAEYHVFYIGLDQEIAEVSSEEEDGSNDETTDGTDTDTDEVCL